MDLTVKEELFAIRFKTAEIAQKFQEKFNEGRELNKVVMAEARERVIEKLNNMKVVDENGDDEDDKEANGEESKEEASEEKAEDQKEASEEKPESPEVAKETAEVSKETGSGEQTGESPKVEAAAEPKKEEARVDSPEK